MISGRCRFRDVLEFAEFGDVLEMLKCDEIDK
jgi:hypothetical protein